MPTSGRGCVTGPFPVSCPQGMLAETPRQRSPMTQLADRTIDADHRTYERLARLVSSLSDDQLSLPSGPFEWTVCQVLSPRKRRGARASSSTPLWGHTCAPRMF